MFFAPLLWRWDLTNRRMRYIHQFCRDFDSVYPLENLTCRHLKRKAVFQPSFLICYVNFGVYSQGKNVGTKQGPKSAVAFFPYFGRKALPIFQTKHWTR